MNINNVVVSGRLARNSELALLNNDDVMNFAILKFTLVNNRMKKVSTGWESIPQYFDCVVLGERAKRLEPRLLKGNLVVVSGTLRYESWSDSSNSLRSKVSITVNNIDMLVSNRSTTASDSLGKIFDLVK